MRNELGLKSILPDSPERRNGRGMEEGRKLSEAKSRSEVLGNENKRLIVLGGSVPTEASGIEDVISMTKVERTAIEKIGRPNRKIKMKNTYG